MRRGADPACVFESRQSRSGENLVFAKTSRSRRDALREAHRMDARQGLETEADPHEYRKTS
jgi:hypothetical protein